MQHLKKHLLITTGLLAFACSCRDATQALPASQPTCPPIESIATILGGSVRQNSAPDVGLCLYESSDNRQLGAAIFSAPMDSEVWTKTEGLRVRAEADLRSGLAQRFSPARPADLALWYPERNQVSVFVQSGFVLRHVVLTFDNRALGIADVTQLADELIDMALNAPVGAA
jgi:hypothetical protein